MPEIKGKMETRYQWQCAACGHDNMQLDNKLCADCGKELGDEKMLRHFRLIPAPIRVGIRIA